MLVANPDVIRWGLVGAGSVCEVRRTRLDDRQMSAGRRLLVVGTLIHPVMGAASADSTECSEVAAAAMSEWYITTRGAVDFFCLPGTFQSVKFNMAKRATCFNTFHKDRWDTCSFTYRPYRLFFALPGQERTCILQGPWKLPGCGYGELYCEPR